MHRLILLLAAALALAACAGAPQTIAQRQVVDGLTVTLERPAEIVTLRDYELTVTLSDAEGRPVDGASVYLDLVMPGMVMGVNQPIADALGGGKYRVRTAFSMDGDWQTQVHIRADGREYVAGFDHPVAATP